jgi:hypothetical protein
MSERKYYVESRRKGTAHVKYIAGMITELVTSCVGISF